MGFFRKYINQTRKPEGFLGRMMVNGMNSGHAKMSDWGISHLKKIAPETILDVGCGGGRNIGELLKKYPSANGTAIDYSDISVEKAKTYNANEIKSGRCRIRQGDVSNLGLTEEFDLATAFETIYFWPGLEKCFAEVYNALKPGGVFMIVNESDGTDKTGLRFEKMIDGMKCHTVEEISYALTKAGFSEIMSDHHNNKPWITVIAKK